MRNERSHISTLFLAFAMQIGCGNKHEGKPPPPSPSPTKARGVSKFGPAVRVDVEQSHACAVLASGKVACWGELHSTLEPLTTTPVLVQGVSDAIEVLDGCARTKTNIACWYNELVAKPVAGTEGALDLGQGEWAPCFVTKDHTVACLEPDKPPVPVPGITDVAVLGDLGYQSRCFVKTDGSIACKGDVKSDLGKLPDVKDAVGIARIDQSLACAIRKTGELACFSAYPDQVARMPKSADQIFSIGLLDCFRQGGEVRCRKLAEDAWTRVPVDGVKDLSCTSNTCCAVTTTGAIRCWGDNSNGRLGDGFPAAVKEPVKVEGLPAIAQIATGHGLTLARARDGAVYAWGLQGNGKRLPTKISDGAELVAVGELAAASAQGKSVSIHLPSDREGWQTERLPDLPADVRALALDTMNLLCAALVDGTTRCLEYSGEGPTWKPFAGMKDIVQLASNCGVTKSGKVACMLDLGDEEHPKLRTEVVPGITTAKGMTSNYVELENGDVVIIDRLEGGKWTVTPQPDLHGITSIQSGGYTWSPTCGLKPGPTAGSPAKVICWSRDEVPAPLALEAIAVSGGNKHACAIDPAGAVWCWGDDREGELGRGRVVYSPEPMSVVGIGP